MPKRPKPKLKRKDRNVVVVALLFLIAVLCIGAFEWTKKIEPERQLTVRGELVEASKLEADRGRCGALRFTISTHSNDFRVDPAIFSDTLNCRIPFSLKPGAVIDVTADAAEVASPTHPLLAPNLKIVWVNGLSINGNTLFGVKNVVRHQRTDWLYWLVLLTGAVGFFVYAVRRWYNAKLPVSVNANDR